MNENPAGKAAIERVRSEVARIIGNKTLRLSEGLGRLVITTSQDMILKGPGHFQLGAGALASIPLPENLQALLDEQNAFKARGLASIGDVGMGAIMRHERDEHRWMMVLRDASGQGKWRTQSFDLKGFSGHVVYADRAAAVEAAASSGFIIRDDAALDRIQDSPAFQRGLYLTELISRINSGELSMSEGNRLMSDYDANARVLQSVAASGAQAFVAKGGEVMYLLADRIREGTEAAVFLHEIVHRFGKRVLGQTGFENLVNQVKDWIDSEEDSQEYAIYKAAAKRARIARRAAGGNGSVYDDELFAYSVEEAVNREVKPSAMAHAESAQGWLDQVVGTLRGVIRSITGEQIRSEQINAQGLVDLAYAFAQLESSERASRIMAELKPHERQIVNGWVARNGEPMWYSDLERRVRTKGQPRMPAAQWIEWLNAQVRNGIKPDEIEWSGVNDWLRSLPPEQVVRKADVTEFLQANGVQVKDVMLQGNTSYGQWLSKRLGIPVSDVEDHGAYDDDAMHALFLKESGRVRYESYTLPGGSTNYRELLLTLPSKEKVSEHEIFTVYDDQDKVISQGLWPPSESSRARMAANPSWRVERSTIPSQQDAQKKGLFQSSHWDESNVLAHVRLNDRTDVNGSRVLFVEELQSDWGQDGRKNGFSNHKGSPIGLRVPAGPFVTKTEAWVSLALKRVMRLAADEGYDSVALISGDQSADRFGMSRHIEEVHYEPAGQGLYEIIAYDAKGIKVIHEDEVTIEQVATLVGKDMSKRIENDEGALVDGGGYREWRKFCGLKLKAGGEGMRTFYDQVLPNTLKSLLKKNGGAELGSVCFKTNPDGWHITEPERNVHGRWMLKSRFDKSEELLFETQEEAQAELDSRLDTHEQPGFMLTQALREQVSRGLPLFSHLPLSDPTIEFELVKARYRGTDQWMKAPDGSRTQLTERQWLQVRTPSFKAWFGDWEADPQNASRAIGSNGEPQVFYHGSNAAGFSEFETKGQGKTRNTGAFFSDRFSMAASYSRSSNEAPLYRAEQIFEDPSAIDGLEIEEGLLVQVDSSNGRKTWEWYSDEEEALEEVELDEGEQLVSKPGYRIIKDYREEHVGDKDDVLIYLDRVKASGPGVYSVFLNVRDLVEVDWGGRNWDEGPQETVWELRDENGDMIDFAYSKEECDGHLARHPGHTAEQTTKSTYESTDDAARQCRGMGADGVLIKEVWDSGSYGGPQSGNVLVVYKPNNIKSADVNSGAFDPHSEDIRESLPDRQNPEPVEVRRDRQRAA